MTTFDVAFMTASVALTAAGLAFTAYVVRTGVRPRPHDPEAVDRFIETGRRYRVATGSSVRPDPNDRVHHGDPHVEKPGPQRETATDGTAQEFDLDAAVAAIDEVCRQFNFELRSAPSGIWMIPRQQNSRESLYRPGEHSADEVGYGEGEEEFSQAFRWARGAVARDTDLE